MKELEQRTPTAAVHPELGLPFIASLAVDADDDSDSATTTGTWSDPDGSDNT